MSGPRITAEGFDPETGGFAYIMVDGYCIRPHLAAAAPELLEVAQLTQDAIHEYLRTGGTWDFPCLTNLRRAIARATGAPTP